VAARSRGVIRQRHEVPTHLNVEDKAFLGLSVRQFMFLTSGASLGYGLYNEWADLPPTLRIGLGCLVFLIAALLALCRPGNRGLEEWAFVLLRHTAIPKRAVWKPPEPDPADWQASGMRWEALEPRPDWEDER
jgi:hypothetical protein